MKRHNLESMTPIFAVKSQSHLTNSLKGLLLVILSFVTNSGLTQGWELAFGGEREDAGEAVIQTEDGGYVAIGYSESFGEDNDMDIYVVRTDVDGREIWSDVIDEAFAEFAYDLIQTEDQGFLLAGSIQDPGQQPQAYLLKIDPYGKFEWSRQFGEADRFEQFRSIEKAEDGHYILAGWTRDDQDNEDALVVKVDEDGNEVWLKTYNFSTDDDRAFSITNIDGGYAFVGYTDNEDFGNTDIVLSHIDFNGVEVWSKFISTDQPEEAFDLITTQDGNIVLTGYQGSTSDVLVAKYSSSGDSIWTTLVDAFDRSEIGYSIIEKADGKLVVSGIVEVNDFNVDVLIATLDADGGNVWTTNIGNPLTVDLGHDIANTMDGGYIITGVNAQSVLFFNDLTLIKTDPEGNVLTNFIQGNVFVDVDEDCPGMTMPDFGDIPLNEWIIQVKGENNTYFGTTDENGFYSILVDTGTYTVNVFVPNDYWYPCVVEYNLPPITEFYAVDTAHFPILPALDCPYLEVDISANWDNIPGCFDAEYTVKYANMGTTLAEASYIEVELDDDLTFNSASIPSTNVGNLYTFEIGDLPALEGGSFTINTTVDCDVALLQSSVVSVHMYPDTLCVEPDPNWDGSSIEVEGECLTDSIEFRIKNVGDEDMDEELDYIIVEDHVLFQTAPFQLNFLQADTIRAPKNGSTYRIIAEQSEGHVGSNYPTVALEGCVENEGDEFSTGHVAEFPENDQDPFITIDVQEIFDSGLPVEMRGYPSGYRDSLIEANTDLSYLISFKNVGTDTITRVVIRDTLSAHLDISNITPGTSSHPYQFEVYDNGILKITLSDIQLLPGGSAEEALTRGFVKFRIAQKPDNPLGTIINNSAAIFFNFNAPARTNIVRHEIGEFPEQLDSIITSADDIFLPGLEINIYPNPFSESTTIELNGYDFDRLDFTVLDLNGRVLRREQFRGNQFHFYRNHLPAGLYVYRIESRGSLINTGKIVVR